jgi:hypothetical protein
MSKPDDPLISEEDLTKSQQVEEEDEEIEEYVKENFHSIFLWMDQNIFNM